MFRRNLIPSFRPVTSILHETEHSLKEKNAFSGFDAYFDALMGKMSVFSRINALFLYAVSNYRLSSVPRLCFQKNAADKATSVVFTAYSQKMSLYDLAIQNNLTSPLAVLSSIPKL